MTLDREHLYIWLAMFVVLISGIANMLWLNNRIDQARLEALEAYQIAWCLELELHDGLVPQICARGGQPSIEPVQRY